MDLDPVIIPELTAQTEASPVVAGNDAPMRVEPTDAETAEATLRLLRLLERPPALPILHASLLRELHYWLLVGRHGAAVRRLGFPESHQLIRCAVDEGDFRGPLQKDQPSRGQADARAAADDDDSFVREPPPGFLRSGCAAVVRDGFCVDGCFVG